MKINVSVFNTSVCESGLFQDVGLLQRDDNELVKKDTESISEFVEMVKSGFNGSDIVAIILDMTDRKRAFYVYNTKRGNCALSIYEAIAIFIEESKLIEEGKI